MKKLMLIVAIVSFLNVVNAQEPGSTPNPVESKSSKTMAPDERAMKETARAESEFKLSPEQKTKWEMASRERANANHDIRTKMQGSTTPSERKQLRTEARKNNQKFDASVQEFLTGDQKEKYKIWKQEKRKHRKEKRRKAHKMRHDSK